MKRETEAVKVIPQEGDSSLHLAMPDTPGNNSVRNNNGIRPDKTESAWRTAWTKATFLAFCWMGFGLALGCAVFSYYLIDPRLSQFPAWVGTTLKLVVGSFYLVLGGGLVLITVTSLTGIDLLYPHKKPSITVKLLFPIAATLSQILRVDRNHLRASFVKVNNALTMAQSRRIKGDRILFLLPHCLQIDICNRKITSDIANCVQCGRCPVGMLRELGKRYSLTIEVVNGGTSARRKVKSFRPDGIVAVACERDLTLGIQDVYPIPVYGVINDRPHGPCLNTCVDMDLVEEAIRFFIGTPEKCPNPSGKKLRNISPWIFRSRMYHWTRTVWPWSSILHAEDRAARDLISSVSPPSVVLDIGCGIGAARDFVPADAKYVGLDACLSMARRAAGQGRSVVLAQGNSLPAKDDCADLVISIGVLEYQPDGSSFVQSISRAVRPGGHLLVTSSPASVLTRLRGILVPSVRGCRSETIVTFGRGCGLEPIAQRRTLLQDQFLFRRPAPLS